MTRIFPMLWLFLVAMLPRPAHADERRVMVTGFDAVRVEGPFVVRVSPGSGASAVIRGDARAVDAVVVRVEARTLVVSANPSAWGGWPGETAVLPEIDVATPRLGALMLAGGGRIAADSLTGQAVRIALSGSGAITVGGVTADQIDVEMMGTGTLTLGGRALRARINTMGAGRIDAGGLDVRDLVLSSESLGDTRARASETAEVTALGLGSILVDGDATCRISGPGPVRCGRGE